jgi:signal transduction histidine kinase
VSDELLAWFALAMALAALARLNYFLFPSVYSDWVFTGDMLRFGVYLVILIGALRQVGSYQAAAARAAILEERKRIALDLHDSLAQDLAYISLQGQRLADSHEGAAGIAAAAKGALAQSRGTIATLRVGDLPLGEAIERVATALAERHGAELDLELDAGVDVRSVERDELLNVVSEAISNAARHGEASKLRITLSRGAGGLTLTITDDGRGFDVEAKRPDGAVGLNGMRERVERIGGDLGLESAPGQGTTIEVRLR